MGAHYQPSHRLIDLPWEHLGTTIGLGFFNSFIDKKLLPKVRLTWLKLLLKCNEDPENLDHHKKLHLLWTVILAGGSTGKRRQNMRHKLSLIEQDNWDHFTLGNFNGRNNGKIPKTTDGSEKIQRLIAYDKLTSEEQQSSVGSYIRDSLQPQINQSVQRQFNAGNIQKAYSAATSRTASADQGEESFNLLTKTYKDQTPEPRSRSKALVKKEQIGTTHPRT